MSKPANSEGSNLHSASLDEIRAAMEAECIKYCSASRFHFCAALADLEKGEASDNL